MQTTTDEVYVGRYMGQHEHRITPELVQHYADSVADHNPWYTGESPFGGPIAPALVLHSDVFQYGGWYLPNIYGNLHARQEWELFQPIMVGDSVVTRSTIVDRYIKREREYVVNEVVCFGDDGRMLNRGRTHQSFLRDTGASGVVVDREREKGQERRFDPSEDDVLEEISGPLKEIGLEMCRKFSGPRKNYHNDIEEARKLGFPDIVVQGMMPLCFLSEMMTARFSAGWYLGGRMNVNLVNVLWGGERVASGGVVREMRPEGSRRRARLEVWCAKEDGTKVVVGTASALLD